MTIWKLLADLKKCNVVPLLVDDQLKLVGETDALTAGFIDEIKAMKGELIAFLKETLPQSTSLPILQVPAATDYPASNAQHRIWLLSQFRNNSAYNITSSFYLVGEVNYLHLEEAFRKVIQRHDSLRTVFREREGALRQLITDNSNFRLEYRQLSADESLPHNLQHILDRFNQQQFDLEHGPLISVALLKISATAYILNFGLHHTIGDGWSAGVLVREMMAFYESICKGRSFDLPRLPIQYKDYTHWLAEKINGEYGQAGRTFWLEKLSGKTSPLNVPGDFSRPATSNFAGEVLSFFPPETFYVRIQHYCKQHRTTPFNFFRATVSLLLAKYTGQSSVIFGTPVSGRNHFDLQQQIGLYINTLPMRIDVDDAATFLDFLHIVSEDSMKCFRYQDYPLDKIIEDLGIETPASGNALFDVMMVVQNTGISKGTIDITRHHGFQLFPVDEYFRNKDTTLTVRKDAKLDLTLYFDHDPSGKFYISIEYATALFKKETIERLLDMYMFVAEQALATPEKTIREMGIITDQERSVILHTFNSPIGDISDDSIVSLLQPALVHYADNTAILENDTRISYAEISRYSDNIAAALSPVLNGQGTLIGLLLDRSAWMIPLMLGVLKTGAAYVPIDPRYPRERISYMIDDADLQLIIAADDCLRLIPADFSGTVIPLSRLKAASDIDTGFVTVNTGLREQPAYMIYTSGSTGKPKAVIISHRNAIAFLKWAMQEFHNTSFDILYATTSICFDLSVFELFFPLLTGKTIRILDTANNIQKYALRDQGIFLNVVPSVVRHLLDSGFDWQPVTALNMAGETVPASFIKPLETLNIEVRNLYGPTEDTTYSTVYRFNKEDGLVSVPIGRPVGYTQLYILDNNRQLLPRGVEGEIYLSGQSVAPGYFRRPELTAERFLPNPFVPGMTMYRTGDRGKWLDNGMVAFLGRRDEMVKVRGYRIELAEIERNIEGSGLVEQVAVVCRHLHNEATIIAYCKGISGKTEAVKYYLATHLPAYMMPAHWIILEHFVLNANGKIDRNLLPDPITDNTEEKIYIRPANATERTLAGMWETILNRKDFGITESFAELGGHSLKVGRLRSLIFERFGREVSLKELFVHQTIKEQARLVDSKKQGDLSIILSLPENEWYPVSFAQQHLWSVDKLSAASAAYNMSAAFRVKGELSIPLLEQAIRKTAERYEILRTTFSDKEGALVQVIAPPNNTHPAVDIYVEDDTLDEEALTAILRREIGVPFNFHTGPLFRCIVVKNGHYQQLAFNIHHIICDGWSVVVLYKEIIGCYESLRNNESTILPSLPFQYKDFAAWQRQQNYTNEFNADRLFWMELFAGGMPVSELSTDFRRGNLRTYNGAIYTIELESKICGAITDLCRKADVSLYTTLITCVAILLNKYTDQQDIVLGTVSAGRDEPGLEAQIGFFVKSFGLKCQLKDDDTFLTLLQRHKQSVMDALAHQSYPFDMLLEDLGLRSNPARSPFFDVMVLLQNIEGFFDEAMENVLNRIELERIPIHNGTSKYDLTFSFQEMADSLLLELEYNTDLFRKETVERMTTHLWNIFRQIATNKDISIADIEIATVEEQKAYYTKNDRTNVGFDRSANIISVFKKNVDRYPHNIAVAANGKELTYQELDVLSEKVASLLLTKYNVSAEELIALYFDRSVWMIVAILAVLKSGAAYVPLDIKYPVDRINYILQDTKARIVLHDTPLPELAAQSASPGIFIDLTKLEDITWQNVEVSIDPSDLAYVIYTSGTTGTPKGVLIEHSNVVRLLFNEAYPFVFSAADRWAMFHSYSFDFSVWEIFGALLYGGTLVITPALLAQHATLLYDFLKTEKVTIFNQTPTAFRVFTQVNSGRFFKDPLHIRYLIFGGEALYPEVLREWQAAMPHCQNINMYGITETTVHVTFKRLLPEDIASNVCNAGLALPTLGVHVLDKNLRQAPIGSVGEIYVSGAGLARGYLNKPALTAERFILHPVTEERMYRSGDFARVTGTFELEYIGRRDDQVKIRGYRIETGEVAAAIKCHAAIIDTVICSLQNTAGENELLAYVIVDAGYDERLLRKDLQRLLPVYMIPTHIIEVERFPLNNNGKLDKAALPVPGLTPQRLRQIEDVWDATDKQLLHIFQAVLERSDISKTDNFFDVGGHSLKATKVLTRINEKFDINLDLKDFFMLPTIENLSGYIKTLQFVNQKSETQEAGNEEMIF
jgi:amino acid adenylation domain-containing protein